MKKFLLSILFSSLCFLTAMSQISLSGFGLSSGSEMEMQNPVTFSASYAIDEGNAVIVVTADIDEGWHLYSQNHKGTSLPLVFNIESSSCLKPLAERFTESPKPTEHYDEFLKETELYHSGRVTYTMPVKVMCNDDFSVVVSYDGQACIDGACVPVVGEVTVLVTGGVTAGDAQSEDSSLLWDFFLIAFLGGLLGILTPCVFPMIPMTVSYFMKHGGKRQALFYGFSIILIYVIVGVVLSAIMGQGFANDISTHWLPNVLFTIIFIVFAISLLGYFEINLPSSWINGSAKNEERAGYVGTFFMALTLVLVSFSCTLPIAGAVALGAADGSYLKPIIGMFGFALAFALPFTLFAFFPNWLDKLPKSGSWMGALKVTLAIVELAFAFKFLSVADQAYDWGILNREIFIAIWIVLFIVLGLYYLGVLHFPIDGDADRGAASGAVEKKKPNAARIVMAVISFLVVAYLVPGMWGAPLNAISGWLPPMKTQTLFLGSANKEMHNNLDWQTNAVVDYDAALDSSKVSGKPVLLMFTGHGCVNCRKMEQLCLANDSVATKLKSDYIICTLYVDDKVARTPNGEMLGDKNKRIQKDVFHQNAQPCHYVLASDGSVISGPIFYETNPNNYLEFLRVEKNAK